MLLYAIPIGLALVGTTYTCWKGVGVGSGTSHPAGDSWRVRWACWRYLAEIRRGSEGAWEKAGSASTKVVAVRIAQVALAKLQPGEPGAGGMIQVKPGRATG